MGPWNLDYWHLMKTDEKLSSIWPVNTFLAGIDFWKVTEANQHSFPLLLIKLMPDMINKKTYKWTWWHFIFISKSFFFSLSLQNKFPNLYSAVTWTSGHSANIQKKLRGPSPHAKPVITISVVLSAAAVNSNHLSTQRRHWGLTQPSSVHPHTDITAQQCAGLSGVGAAGVVQSCGAEDDNRRRVRPGTCCSDFFHMIIMNGNRTVYYCTWLKSKTIDEGGWMKREEGVCL